MIKEKSVARISMLSLLHQRRFLPYFLTQFFGAFNDNILRQALILFITTSAVSQYSANFLNNIALALFILPFFLFSGLAGQFADKLDKAQLVRSEEHTSELQSRFDIVCRLL